MKVKLFIILFSIGYIFCQNIENNTQKNKYSEVLLDKISFDSKRDTIIYIKSVSDDMIVTANSKNFQIFEIIKINSDSIEVELLNYKNSQWKKTGMQNSHRSNRKTPSIKQMIAIEDIYAIRFIERESMLTLFNHLLVLLLLYGIDYYFL